MAVNDRIWNDLEEGACVCHRCFDVYYRVRQDDQAHLQPCDCNRVREAPRWAHMDFNRYTELCRSCLLTPLWSGSRWAVWFCRPCQGRAMVLDSLLGELRLFIGRHSLMHGNILSLVPPDTRAAAKPRRGGFMCGMEGSEAVLESWRSTRLKAAFRAARVPRWHDAQLEKLRGALATAQPEMLDEEQAFRALGTHMGLSARRLNKIERHYQRLLSEGHPMVRIKQSADSAHDA